MSIFHDYAPFYDGSGQIRFAVLMGQYLDEVLERHPVAGRRALDLACGTGTLALILADAGWDVVGLDRSEPMLALARAKAAGADVAGRLAFVHGDMRDPLSTNDQGLASREWGLGSRDKETGRQGDRETRRQGDREHEALDLQSPIPNPQSLIPNPPTDVRPSSFDLVICTYDSLNYLFREDDLARCFDGAARALRPGGLFFADMNTRAFLEYDWGVCEVLERPGFVQVTQSYFDPATASSTMALTGFAGDDESGYYRFEEVHVERAYEPDVVARHLAAAGLQIEAAYDCFTFQPAHERSRRIAWVARKLVLNSEF